MRSILSFFSALLVLIAAPLAAQDFPELTGRVVDQAEIIPADVELQLNQQLEALEVQSQRQLVVVTLASLQGYPIGDFGYQLGRHWGIGDAERNDGIMLIVAPNERETRIEVGYGLEPIITDGLSWEIIDQLMIPQFRQGDFPAGIAAGTNALVSQLQLPEEEARAIAAQANEQRSSDGGFPIGGLFWFAIIFFFFILPMLRGGGRRRRYRGRGREFGDTARDIILWEVGSAIVRGAMSGGDDWGGGGGSGGGGGFSGGGGSFGGGGASGGW